MGPRQDRSAGFTLLELMIVVTVIAVLASIGVPVYTSALRTARICKATQELRVLSQAIDVYRSQNDGQLPLTLYEVDYGGRLDPWGTPYCYLNYATGTGDGLQWAVSVGLVDPSSLVTTPAALTPPTANGNGNGNGNGGKKGTGGGNGGGNGIGGQVAAVASDLTGQQVADLVHSLKQADLTVAPVFTAVPVEDTRRRDKYLFPLNTDYDLFSIGPDGRSSVSLCNAMALDDVIRANDGGFFGVAASY